MSKITNRLMGAEVEYLAGNDRNFDYINEYYSRMREVNSILLPGSDIKESLFILKDILMALNSKLEFPLGTRGWVNSYGIAYNGVHLHLSGNISKVHLKENILKVIGKHGMSPRTVSSWHIFNRPTNFNFKNKRKHCPIYLTPRGTVEIRVLDVEYFLDDDIIVDLSKAIDAAYNEEYIEGDNSWVNTLVSIPLEAYRRSCEFLDGNLYKGWRKVEDGIYEHTTTEYSVNFTRLDGWTQQTPEEVPLARGHHSYDREDAEIVARIRNNNDSIPVYTRSSTNGIRARGRSGRSDRAASWLSDTSYTSVLGDIYEGEDDA